MTATLEHTNLTVTNPDATAAWMCAVFGWRIRWSGPALNGGRSVHVGNDNDYVALYSPREPARHGESSYALIGGLNHIGIQVKNLDTAETRVKEAGFTPFNHADYEPGRRFYFHDADGIEYEAVQYDD